VVAAGRSGASTHDELEMFREIDELLHPDLVVWGYVTNDPDEGFHPQFADPVRAVTELDEWFPMIADQLRQTFVREVALREENAANGWSYSAWEKKLLEGENFEAYRRTVAAVGTALAGRSSLLVTLPNAPVASFAPRYAPVLPLWRDAGVEVLDLLPAARDTFAALDDGGVRWSISPTDGHPGPRLCRFLALQLVEHLEAHHPESLGRTTRAPPVALAINDWLPARLAVEQEADGRVAFAWPAMSRGMPLMPWGHDAVVLSLNRPARLASIEVEGSEAVTVWGSFLDVAEGFDDGVWHQLARGPGRGALPADVAGRELVTLRIDGGQPDARIALRLREQL
jgi:hypothetical protein